MSKLSGPSRAQARLQNRLLQRVRRHGNLTALYGRSENGHRHPPVARHPTVATALPAPLPDVPLVRATLVAGHPYQGTTQQEAEIPVLVVEVPEASAPEPEAAAPPPEAPQTAAPPPPQPWPEEEQPEQPAEEQQPSVPPVGDAAPDPAAEAAASPPPAGAPDEGVIPPAGDLASAEDSWRRLQRVWRKQEEKRASGVPPKVELEAPWLRRLFE